MQLNQFLSASEDEITKACSKEWTISGKFYFQVLQLTTERLFKITKKAVNNITVHINRDLRYTGDVNLIAGCGTAQYLIDQLHTNSKYYKLQINTNAFSALTQLVEPVA